MKMVVVIYGAESDEDVMAALKAAGIDRYTKLCEARGEGQETQPKLATHIWPGKNNVLLLAVEDEAVPEVVRVVRELKREHPRAGVKAFVAPVEEIA